MATDINRTIEAIWRIESPKLIGGRTPVVRDVGLAEELAQDALVSALSDAASLPRPNLAGRHAAGEHDVRRQAARVEEILLRAVRGRRA